MKPNFLQVILTAGAVAGATSLTKAQDTIQPKPAAAADVGFVHYSDNDHLNKRGNDLRKVLESKNYSTQELNEVLMLAISALEAYKNPNGVNRPFRPVDRKFSELVDTAISSLHELSEDLSIERQEQLVNAAEIKTEQHNKVQFTSDGFLNVRANILNSTFKAGIADKELEAALYHTSRAIDRYKIIYGEEKLQEISPELTKLIEDVTKNLGPKKKYKDDYIGFSPDDGLNNSLAALGKILNDGAKTTEELKDAIWLVRFDSSRYISVIGEASFSRRSATVLELLEQGLKELEKTSPEDAKVLRAAVEKLSPKDNSASIWDANNWEQDSGTKFWRAKKGTNFLEGGAEEKTKRTAQPTAQPTK